MMRATQKRAVFALVGPITRSTETFDGTSVHEQKLSLSPSYRVEMLIVAKVATLDDSRLVLNH